MPFKIKLPFVVTLLKVTFDVDAIGCGVLNVTAPLDADAIISLAVPAILLTLEAILECRSRCSCPSENSTNGW